MDRDETRLTTALIVPVALPPGLARFHTDHEMSAALACPPHITLLYPFVRPAEVGDALLTRLHALLEPFPAFPYRLTEVRRWPPDTTYLHPEPEAPFRAVQATLADAFPEHPLYGGAFPFTPHVSLVDDGDEAAHAVAPEVAAPELPVALVASSIDLIAQDRASRWTLTHRFELRA